MTSLQQQLRRQGIGTGISGFTPGGDRDRRVGRDPRRRVPSGELHVIHGRAGTGKTTAALQFLLQGAADGEKAVFITLSQTDRALRKIAGSPGWDLDGVEIVEQSAS